MMTLSDQPANPEDGKSDLKANENNSVLPNRPKPKPSNPIKPATKSSKDRIKIPPHALLHTHLSLLQLELAAETAQTSLLLTSTPPTVLARAGLALLNLAIIATRTGLGGRTVLSLGVDAAYQDAGSEGRLPEHGIRVGDVVRLGERAKEGKGKKSGGGTKTGGGGKDAKGDEKEGVEGVVVRVGEKKVEIALGRSGGKGGQGDDGDSSVDALGDGRLWLYVAFTDRCGASGIWDADEITESSSQTIYRTAEWCRRLISY